MDGTEIGSDKTVKEAATYVDQNNQKSQNILGFSMI